MIEREFYPLNKAAEMIGCTVDDLLHLGASGRIHIIILPTGLEGVMYVNDYSGQTVSGQPAVRSVQTINDRYCLVHKDFISKYEAAKSVGDGYSLGRMMTSDNSGCCWNLVHKDDYIPMSDTSLFVLTSDINSLRNTSTNEQTSSSKQLSEVVESAHEEPQVEVVVNDAEKGVKQTKKRTRGQTQINIFLTELCQKQDINNLSGESLVRAIKPLVGTLNCPVKKYHGFYDGVCVDWKEGTGSTKGTWGKKSFQNFVTEFKEIETKKAVK